MGITIRTMEDLMINAQINPSIETMETDLEMDLLTIFSPERELAKQ